MKKGILLVFVWVFALCQSAGAFEGPLGVKNQFPLFLSVLPPRLESALTGDSFSADLSHSSVFMIKNSPQWSLNLDMEVTELAFRYKKEIPKVLELGIEVPFQSFESGFMDSFLESYHNFFGFSDYGRSTRPSNEFLYEVRRDGVLILQGKNGRIGLGDIRLSAKKMLLTGDPALSVKAEVQLPTGDASEGFGTGSVSGAISVLADKRISGKFMTYWNAGVIFPGELRAMETVSLKTSVYGGAALEAALWKKFGLVTQVLFQTSPYPKMEIGTMDRISALLSVGGRYSAGKDNLEFSLTEDPNTAGAPDVSFTFGYKRKF